MIYESLLAALRLQRDAQRHLSPDWAKTLSGMSLLNEHATIHIGLHRQSGHSTALRKLADLTITDTDLMEYGLPIIIGRRHDQLRQQYPGHAIYTRDHVTSSTSTYAGAFRDQDRGLVLVDGTFDWNPGSLNEFKHDVARMAASRLTAGRPFSLIMVQ